MGAVTFSLDPQLVAALQSALPLGVLVETGTFKGDTVSALESYFNKVVSMELSEALCSDAVKRFADYSHVRILQGNSGDKLREMRSEFQDVGVLYWLDAHWCVATDTAGGLSQCPLLAELQAIGKLNEKSVVLIDDARLFLAAPLSPHEISHWPNFHQIVEQLMLIGTSHELMVVNDVIAFFPKPARKAIEIYAQSFGMDWLVAANCLREHSSHVQQLESKEVVIQEKEVAIQNLHRNLSNLDEHMAQQLKTLRAYRMAYGGLSPLGPVARVIRRIYSVMRPRLGWLSQYAARPLSFHAIHHQHALQMYPRISIATPSYQQGAYIERTIRSVLDQGYPKLQYFVQDGGSKDSTVEVLKQYADKLSGWTSEKDSGQSQAINLGFAHTDGEIMAWLNSDDLLLPGALHTVADYFNRYPDVDVVYGNRLLVDEKDMEIGRWILPGHDSDVLSWADYVPQETLFWRRRIWEKVGGKVDESFRFAMDWDLLVRFRDAGARFGHIPQFLGAFRIHEHQKTSVSINEVGHQEMNRIRERILGRVPDRKEVRKVLLPYLVKHIVVDMVYRVKKRLGMKA